MGTLLFLMHLWAEAAPAEPPTSTGGWPLGNVVLLPTIGLEAKDGQSPPAEVVDKAWKSVMAAAQRSRLSGAAWSYSGTEPVPAEAAKAVARLAKAPVPPEVQKLLDEAEKARGAFNFPVQIERLTAAVQALTARAEELGQVDALIETEIKLAAAYLNSGEESFAEEEFATVLRMRPDAAVDLRRYAPNVLTFFNEVKARVLAEPTMDMSIDVKPKGALIVINGFVAGPSPRIVGVRKGNYLVQAVAPGYEPFTQRIQATGVNAVHLDDELRRERVHQIADNVLSALKTSDDPNAVVRLAGALALATGADAVLLSGITDIDGGYALVAVLCTDPPRRVVGTFDRGFGRAEAAAAAALDWVMAHPSSDVTAGKYDAFSVTRVPIPVKGIELDFGQRLLGRSWVPPRTNSAAPGWPGPLAMPAAPKGTCEGDDAPLYCNAWPYVVATAVVAALGGGLYMALRPDERRPHDRVTVEVGGPDPTSVATLRSP